MLYFAYGSNLDQAQMKNRCPGASLIGVAFLKNYELGFTWYSPGWKGGVADILPSRGSEVWGLAYAVTEADLDSLDTYEGYPRSYTRHQIGIEILGKSPAIAWAYEVVNKSEFIPPTQAYLRILLDAAEHFGFPQTYKTGLRKFQKRITV